LDAETPADATRPRSVKVGDASAAVRAILTEPGSLRLVVQPIIDIAQATVTGYEALTRIPRDWEVGPEEFFAAAASLGCSAQLSLLVLAALQRLRETCPPNRFLTVNLSPHDLADPEVQKQFVGSWSGVIIELTEAAWPKDPDSVLAGVELARQAGARIASDDVGAGYAGLLQLVRLRPDLIKVDRALVSRLGTDPAAESVLRLLGDLASQLDGWVLVEGVETQDQLAVALRLGAPLVQGWLFGRAEEPWPSDPDLTGLRRLRLRSTFTDTVAAFMRDAYPGEVHYDRDGRPEGILVDGSWIAAMTLAASTPAWVAVERSLHRRNATHRLTPLAVTDGHGMLVGLVDIEPLILANPPSARASNPDKFT